MPAGRPVGHAVLNHQPYRQIDHTRGGVPARRCQIGQVRLKVLATLGAVMLRIGDHKMTRTRQGEVAQGVPCPRRLLVPIRRMPTMRTHVPSVVATLGNHLWLGQGGNRGDPFGGIGSRRTRTEHCCGLLAHRFGPTLYDNGPSAAIPKPGIFAIVSKRTWILGGQNRINQQSLLWPGLHRSLADGVQDTAGKPQTGKDVHLRLVPPPSAPLDRGATRRAHQTFTRSLQLLRRQWQLWQSEATRRSHEAGLV
jgi:hypothetical protein